MHSANTTFPDKGLPILYNMAGLQNGLSESSAKITVAMFGAGRIGCVHLKSIARHPRIRLKWLVEEFTDRAMTALDNVGLENVAVIPLKEVAKVYEDPSVQGVVVCTPTPTHHDIIIDALRAGKAVFCEKPVALNSTAADECYRVAEECKLPLLCGFTKHFDPSFQAVITRTRAGEIGQVRYIKTTFRDTLDPNFEGLAHLGGCFLDLALHDVYVVCACLGEYPITASGDGSAFVKEINANDDFDQAIVNLKFPSGALATIEMSRFCSYGYDQRVEVFGEKGMLEVTNPSFNHTIHSSSTAVSKVPLQPSFPERYEEAFYNEMDHFVKVIQGKEELCISRADSVAVIRIVEACEKAAKTKTIIDLQW